jgi:ectoine hydroxylase-related dioxygenase (phytanoyl-CoA dioxygenase family)
MPLLKLQAIDSPSGVRPFRELRVTELNSRALWEHLAVHGYVLIRNLLFPRDLNRLYTETSQIAAAAGWLDPNRDPLDRVANPGIAFDDTDPSFKRVSDQVFNLESFHALPHHSTLRATMELLVGPRVLVHPKPIPRLVFPNAERFQAMAHQDHYAIAGDLQTYTAWMPLHDCTPKFGPLQILEGSHRYGLQKTPPGTGVIPKTAAIGDYWVGGRINAGDVLLFHCLTVHAASPNRSNQLRLSVDCRFQSYDRPINPANLVFNGSAGKSWESVYANWRYDRLKYYWKHLPLQFKPSLAELANLAQTADTPEKRDRYARILAQLEAQLPLKSH